MVDPLRLGAASSAANGRICCATLDDTKLGVGADALDEIARQQSPRRRCRQLPSQGELHDLRPLIHRPLRTNRVAQPTAAELVAERDHPVR